MSVVVPVHSGGTRFVKCLAALQEAIGPHDEILVVADGETDGAWRQAARASRTRVLVLSESRGAAAARNAGAREAAGDVLLFIDADVLAPPDTVERAREQFLADPHLDAIVGSYDDDPEDSSFHSRYRNLLHHYVHQSADPDLFTFWGACGAVRRSTFLALGGFDERYGKSSIEDIEFGYRMTSAGHRIRMVKDLQVKHLKSWTPRSLLATDTLRRAAPWAELLIRKRRIENNLNVGYGARVSTLATALLPASLGVSLWSVPAGAALAVFLLLLTIGLNKGFYAFLGRRCGPLFALRAIPWHLLYFFSCAVGFLIGAARATTPQSRPVTIPSTPPILYSCSVTPLLSSGQDQLA